MPEHPEACAEWQEDLAGWLVAQLPPAREAALADHLSGCGRCGAEAESLLAVAAASLTAEPVEERAPTADDAPPVDLGARIAERLAAERARRRARPWRTVAGAAAAAVLVVAVLVVRSEDRPRRIDGERVELAVVPEGAEVDAVVGGEPGGSVVQVVARGLDPDETYALWLTEPGGTWADRVPAGTFRAASDGSVDVVLPCALPADVVGRIWATTTAGDIAFDSEPA